MTKTVGVVLGTRPEAIKLAPVVLRLRDEPGLRCHVCAAAQHRELLDQVLSFFGIVPEADLDLMRPGQSLAELTSRAVAALDAYFARSRLDLLLVQGDTTTAFCAALAAFYHRIPVGHVEAGLRTGDLGGPWPEEANRSLIARLAALHFAPTPRARENLLREGIAREAIEITGNPGVDALFLALDRIPGRRSGTQRRRTVLITAHRREHFGHRLHDVCEAIADLAGRFPDVGFLFPVHPNPRVREAVEAILARSGDPRLSAGNVCLMPPLAYPEFVAAMAESTLILTDSGGVQEEAPSLGKPVLVLRDTTERPEAVEAGTVRLVGSDRPTIVAETTRLLTDPDARAAMTRRHNPYGDGRAAGRIAERCRRYLGLGG
jgi:UDP-N-acetylglucosamine 2-epimerase (non-hydrolysing)